jgi:hypothetical protein
MLRVVCTCELNIDMYQALCQALAKRVKVSEATYESSVIGGPSLKAVGHFRISGVQISEINYAN